MEYAKRMSLAVAAWTAIGTILFGGPVAWVNHSAGAATLVALVVTTCLGFIAGVLW